MVIPAAGLSALALPAVVAATATPLAVWDQDSLPTLLIAGREAAEQPRFSTALRTPAGEPTLEIPCPRGDQGDSAWLRLVPATPLRAGGSYEIRLLARGCASLRLALAGGATEEPPLALTRSWQELFFTVVVPLALSGPDSPPIPLLEIRHQGAAVALHLGGIVMRQRQVIASLDAGWSAFLHARAPASWDAIPSTLDGPHGPVAARLVDLAGGSVDLAALAGEVRERDSAILVRSFESPVAGILRLGVSADWWWELRCNGETVFSALQQGNGSGNFVPQDHLLEIPVRAGVNVLSLQVLAGSRGWRLVMGALAVAQRPACPQGRLITGEFAASAIYPGTTRRYWVYVPAQYDAARPACLHVGQDGHQQAFTDAMDRLIDGQEMPVTVGLFITSGHMPAPADGMAARGNRCYEYDSLGDDYARFVLEEMIPFVVKTHGLALSDSGDDRSIGGCSSGGICAFNAAWERPDAFRRVYTNSGSFVAFRGGNLLPALIRKSEAKPIRVFTHVATQDMENSGGNWWFTNLEFERSLAFSGYEYQHQWSQGGHGHRYLDAFPDAMRWLWRDHPAPIVAGLGPPRTQDVLLPDQPWRMVLEGLGQATSVSADSRGEVLVCDAGSNRIVRLGVDGGSQVVQRDAGLVSALAHGPDDRLYGISPSTGRILAFESAGQPRVVAAGVPGCGLVAMRDGGFYAVGQDNGEGRVWRVEADGTSRIVDTGLRAATAVAVSIDGWVLYVADGGSHFVNAYRILPDGSLANRERMVWLHVPDTADDSGASALACAAPANLILVATRLGIQTSARDGHNQCIFPSPGGRLQGLCFGGARHDVLHITCAGRVYARTVRLRGHPVSQEPIKPEGYSL